MDLYCVMGNPVEHSRSPWIHARFAELTGQALRYERRLAPVDGFAAAVAGFRAEALAAGDRARGCNVTVPFKLDAATLADRLTPRARLAGAVNVLDFAADGVLGDNSDGVGLVADIVHNAGVPVAGADLLLIGAGGAAAGVLGPLLEQRPRRVVLANRTLAKAEWLVRRHADLAMAHGAGLEARALDAFGAATDDGFDIVVNASASSLSGAAAPVPSSVLRPGALALDLMYGPAAAGFLAWAAEHGARPRDGLGMLVEQAAQAFLLWRGVRPLSGQVLAELRERLG
ncbi:MAG: shikimate dehydrogenase [Comamonadaceae bacterium]|nr:MAG: shikimate dehydrogenase [Comamonadaceae bacterium]